jgi:hypothetical protein
MEAPHESRSGAQTAFSRTKMTEDSRGKSGRYSIRGVESTDNAGSANVICHIGSAMEMDDYLAESGSKSRQLQGEESSPLFIC